MEKVNYSVNDHRPVVNIFWTGGWDSTFRIISLLDRDIIIQPFYLKDNRRSEWHELNAMSEIRHELINLASRKCTLKQVEILKVSDVSPDREITDAFNYFNKRCHVGSQYEWLARFAKEKRGIEAGILTSGGAKKVITSYGKIKKIECKFTGTNYVLDESESSGELITLFGNFRLPLIEMNKTEIKKEVDSMGLMDIMNKTIFCHRPLGNEPCGECPPCVQAINDGMKFRFSKFGLLRYRILVIKKNLRTLLEEKRLIHKLEKPSINLPEIRH
jgi:hypothetical protein